MRETSWRLLATVNLLSLFELLKINYRLHRLDLQREIENDRIITAEMGLI